MVNIFQIMVCLPTWERKEGYKYIVLKSISSLHIRFDPTSNLFVLDHAQLAKEMRSEDLTKSLIISYIRR